MIQPPLRALQAFAEVARSGTAAAAARTLNVTPSAVSHLLAQLQRCLGLDLITKRGPTLHLTAAGERLGRQLIAGFDVITGALGELHRQTGDVRVSALSSFVSLWLVPRLAGFQNRYRDVRLLLSTDTRPVNLLHEPFDCAVRWGRGGWPGLDAALLFRDRPVVVFNHRLLRAPARAENLPRLTARGRAEDWIVVAAALGWKHRAPALTLETRAMAVQAAIAGIGAAVVDRHLVAGLIGDGLLAEIAPEPPVPVDQGHWIVALPERLHRRPIRQFRDWLVAEAATGGLDLPRLDRAAAPPTPSGSGFGSGTG